MLSHLQQGQATGIVFLCADNISRTKDFCNSASLSTFAEIPFGGKCFLQIFGKEVELTVFKPSTVAIGAAIICACILKPKDDFRSWPEVKVGKFELRRLKIVQGRDRSCPSCWRVDNLSNSSDYFKDGSPVYTNWEEGSPKAFGWRFTLKGLRACVDYGRPSPPEEELMIEYRMYRCRGHCYFWFV